MTDAETIATLRAELATAHQRLKDQAAKHQKEIKIARAISRGLREEIDARDDKEEEEKSYNENAADRERY